MPLRSLSIAVIMLFFFSVLVGIFTYGPAKRTFVVPDKTVSLRSAQELDDLWHASGVHGRIAVIFTRHLNHQFSGIAFPEIDYVDSAMRHGIVRKAYYIVPDRFWQAAVLEYRGRLEYIIEPIVTDTGFTILHEGGRIHAMPLSKYVPELGQEKALVVIEPIVWTQQENSRIDGFIRSEQLTSDLTVIIGDEKPPQQ
jgi:hypothetical protein